VARAERAVQARARQVPERIGLGPRPDTPAGELSGGQQKLLSLGTPEAVQRDPAVIASCLALQAGRGQP
jgi:ABC-type branched-subunit amino acid transport system ATPase component